MRSLVVGASAGLGRALAEELARRGHDLYLVASDERDLEPLARDLTLVHGVTVHAHAADLATLDPTGLRAGYDRRFDDLDCLFLVAGLGDPADSGSVDPVLLDRLIAVNFAAGARIVNVFLDDLATRPGAHIVGVGSVAAARARRNNSVYGASKRALEFYFEAIRHYLADAPCRVQFYRLGYMATQMLSDRVTLLPVARPEQVARAMVDRLGGASGVRYLPDWWRWVMLLFRLLPWPIFKRLDV